MGDDHRVAGRVVDRRLETDLFQLIGTPLGGAADIVFVCSVCADAGDAEQIGQALNGTIDVFIDFVQDAIERRRRCCGGGSHIF